MDDDKRAEVLAAVQKFLHYGWALCELWDGDVEDLINREAVEKTLTMSFDEWLSEFQGIFEPFYPGG